MEILPEDGAEKKPNDVRQCNLNGIGFIHIYRPLFTVRLAKIHILLCISPFIYHITQPFYVFCALFPRGRAAASDTRIYLRNSTEYRNSTHSP